MNPYNGAASGKFQPSAPLGGGGPGGLVRVPGLSGPLRRPAFPPIRSYPIPVSGGMGAPNPTAQRQGILSGMGGGMHQSFGNPLAPTPVMGAGSPGKQELAQRIFQALQGGLDPNQVSNMEHGNAPGQEHGIFSNFGFSPQQFTLLAHLLNGQGSLRGGPSSRNYLWDQLMGQSGRPPRAPASPFRVQGGGLNFQPL